MDLICHREMRYYKMKPKPDGMLFGFCSHYKIN